MSVNDLLTNGKVTMTVAAASGATNTGTILDLIPQDLSKVGIVLSIILTTMYIYSRYIQIKKDRLELEIMRNKEAERIKEKESED